MAPLNEKKSLPSGRNKPAVFFRPKELLIEVNPIHRVPRFFIVVVVVVQTW